MNEKQQTTETTETPEATARDTWQSFLHVMVREDGLASYTRSKHLLCEISGVDENGVMLDDATSKINTTECIFEAGLLLGSNLTTVQLIVGAIIAHLVNEVDDSRVIEVPAITFYALRTDVLLVAILFTDYYRLNLNHVRDGNRLHEFLEAILHDPDYLARVEDIVRGMVLTQTIDG